MNDSVVEGTRKSFFSFISLEHYVQATIQDLHQLEPPAEGETLTGEPIKKLQQLLVNNGIRVVSSGTLDESTKEALKVFQTEHVDRNGFALTVTGLPDAETIEALFYARRRLIIAISNFILTILIFGIFYLWNANFWTQENQSRRDVINIIIVSSLAALFGIRSISAFIVPAAANRIKAFWYRFQTRMRSVVILSLILCVALGLYFYYPRQGFVAPIPKDKQLVHIGIVLNGNAPYARDVLQGFIEKTDSLLAPTKFLARYEIVIGEAESSKYDKNREIFENLLSRFPGGRPDFLVPIGTQVSVYAVKNYMNQVPIVFIAVTDPIQSGIAATLQKDPNRGNLSGVTYGIPPLTRISFIAQAFPNKRVGFVYNPDFPQDSIMKNQLMSLASMTQPPLQIVPLEVKTPGLTPEQFSSADIFFGYYYLNSEFTSFTANSPKPFVGATLADAQRNAIATIANDDKKLGEIAAEKILFRNIIRGIALSDLDIESPDTAIVAVNRNIARKYGISISESALQRAQYLFDY